MGKTYMRPEQANSGGYKNPRAAEHRDADREIRRQLTEEQEDTDELVAMLQDFQDENAEGFFDEDF